MVTRRRLPRQRRELATRAAAPPNEGPRRQARTAAGEAVTTMAGRAEHLHGRPGWNCLICEQPWPCADAKADLLAEFRAFPSVLTVYLYSQMYDAMGDFTSRGEPTPADLYERFVSWTRNL